ncbi:PfkB family carbohydrate kinase [Streptomyces hilarionis]|uniref:PfkB family carbohydrate kinase n=1 Tax=Streptomyces hilarionis TaxID=2839954 RepID=UPI00211A4577|nr:PfkB family carbohydrate kinase [Streptomyces hilarionis]MCQ9129637.1 hypothetical protein [Streptomyces hilarionis]
MTADLSAGPADGMATVLAGARLLPVLTVPSPASAGPLADALAAGGATCAEVTLRTPGAEQALREMAAHGGLAVGAGTVLTAEQAERAVAAGARFVVSPGFDEEVVNTCRDLGVPVVPGVATATELMRADTVFSAGARWFHTGGIFAGLSDTTVDVADEAMAAARRHGVTVSYDPNHRPSLWTGRGGPQRAREVDLRLARHADVVVGALGLAGEHPGAVRFGADEVPDALAEAAGRLPGVNVLATTLREAPSAGVNDWSAAAWSAGTGFVTGPRMPGLHVLDRIGSGDAFAAGLIHGLLAGHPLDRALAYGTAHGALTMTTPGDVSMATLAEVEALVAGADAHVRR